MKTSRRNELWNRARAAALLPALCLALAPSASADLGETLDGIYADQDVQAEMPEKPPGEPRRSVSIPPAQPLAGMAIFIACAVALLLALAATTDWERLRERLPSLPKRRARHVDANAEHFPDWFLQADDLAADGCYAEAVHALLLGALATSRSGEARWPAAATAREIARHSRSDDLRQLVAAAELAHFRGQPASVADFRRCRTCAVRIRESALRAASASVGAGP